MRISFKNICSGLFIAQLVMLLIIANHAKSIAETKEGESKAETDTIPALVMYGNKFLFNNIDVFSDVKVMRFRDSLQCSNQKNIPLVNEVNLYLDILKMNDNQIYLLIDSLFEAEEISYPLINQINYYVAHKQIEKRREEENLAHQDYSVDEEEASIYPADDYYMSWDTEIPNPYTGNISEDDSTLYVVLSDRVKSEFVMPKLGVVTSQFGWREGRNHNGMDIDLEVWDSVVSAFPGMVRVAKFYGGYGRVVVVRHFNGLETTYAHLHRIKVEPGQIVKAGQVIGLGGSSGHSTGSHLHFECRFKGHPINPENFISFKENKLITDTLVLKKTSFGFAAFPIGSEFHLVTKGDYLQKIAIKYGTTTKKLCELNGIKKSKMLIVGEKIRII